MAIRVLVVDDSGFFRRRLTEILNSDPQIEVVDAAVDGKDAVAKVARCKPDVITMDIEMPVMNGIDATREIMRTRPTPILMFSSLSYAGAQATLDALEAGAMDFLPKRFDDISSDKQEARNVLCAKIKALGSAARASAAATTLRQPLPSGSPDVAPAPRTDRATRRAPQRFNASNYDILAIGTSTGGPIALQEVLTQLPAHFPLPIVLIQHMPAKFTEAFANRLNQMCKIDVREAKDGDTLKPGVALLAPGGMQMLVEQRGARLQVRVKQEIDPMQNYKPCVNTTLESLASSIGSRVLAVILTGMGADGKEGCKKLKLRGATIWAQDEASSTIYGMPAAVANIAEQILPVKEVGKKLALNC
jgi:two-component system chemotaxis response regulator CheB